MDTLRRVAVSVLVVALCAILLPFIVGLKVLEAVVVTGSLCGNVLASAWR